jgi:hypothetical protein
MLSRARSQLSRARAWWITELISRMEHKAELPHLVVEGADQPELWLWNDSVAARLKQQSDHHGQSGRENHRP